MPKLRVGIIGVGLMAEICHLPIISKLPDVELVAFCDNSPENLQKRGDMFGVKRRYSSHAEMFDAEELDAVCIFVPPFAHTDAELIAARRGIALFVEKPPTLDMAQAHAISDAITRSGVVNAVGFNERYRVGVEAARERLAGTLPVQALIHRLHGSTAAAYWWMVERLSGGAFVENTIHAVDLLRYLGGEPQTVMAAQVDRPDKTAELDIPLSQCATYTLAGGGVANVTTTTALESGGHQQFLLVAGGKLYDLAGGLAVNGQDVVRDPGERADYVQEFKTFFAAVRSGDQSAIRSRYADAVKSLAACLAVADSARRGGAPVDLTAAPYAISA